MARLYSTSAIRGHGGAGGSYSVPPGYIFVIRCITAFNASAFIPESCSVVLGHSSCTIYDRLLSVFLGPTGNYYDVTEMRVVVEATDVIRATTGSDVDVTVSGYLLTAP